MIGLMAMLPLQATKESPGDDDPDAIDLITTPHRPTADRVDCPEILVTAADVKAASASIPYPAIESLFSLVHKDYRQLAADQKPRYLAPEDFTSLKYLSRNHAKNEEKIPFPCG